MPARIDAFNRELEVIADVLRAFVLRAPPNLVEGFGAGAIREAFNALGTANILRRLSLEQQRSLLDLFTRSAGEMLDDAFESDLVKALFGFDAIVGNYASPYAAGSAYVMLHHAFGEVNGKKGVWGHAIGGMGAITQAMARAARGHGVEIETGRRRARGDRRARPRRRRHPRQWRDHPRQIRRLQRQPETAVYAAVAGRCAADGIPRSHQELAQRLRHLPDERGAERPALVHGAARRRRSSHRRHHHRAEPRLHGPRLAGRARARLEPRAGGRGADPLDARRHARARRASMSRACSASTSRRNCPTANHGTTIARRSPIS